MAGGSKRARFATGARVVHDPTSHGSPRFEMGTVVGHSASGDYAYVEFDGDEAGAKSVNPELLWAVTQPGDGEHMKGERPASVVADEGKQWVDDTSIKDASRIIAGGSIDDPKAPLLPRAPEPDVTELQRQLARANAALRRIRAWGAAGNYVLGDSLVREVDEAARGTGEELVEVAMPGGGTGWVRRSTIVDAHDDGPREVPC
jgi:hypothetical protein